MTRVICQSGPTTIAGASDSVFVLHPSATLSIAAGASILSTFTGAPNEGVVAWCGSVDMSGGSVTGTAGSGDVDAPGVVGQGGEGAGLPDFADDVRLRVRGVDLAAELGPERAVVDLVGLGDRLTHRPA